MPNRRELGYVSAGSVPTIVAPTAYGVATGGIGAAQSTGTLADGFSYSYLTFNSTGTLTVTTAGWFDFCAVGGGAGGINYNNASYATSGGGAGRVVFGSIYLSSNQTITIGAGAGRAPTSAPMLIQATNTTIAATAPFAVGADGNVCCVNGETVTVCVFVGGGYGAILSQGTLGQTGSDSNGYYGGSSDASNNGGGGGGARALGGNGSGTTGGAGGAGVDVSVFIGGSALFKAMGGGGGGSVTGGAAATNGVAGVTGTALNSAGANTGGGGGGGRGIPASGGLGGSGICYIRFR